MKIIQLVDELSKYDLANLNKNRPLDVAVEQLIYAYHDGGDDGGYDGQGVAVYLDNKGQWHLDDISHCSCYGALDGGFNKISYTRPQVVELLKKRASEDWEKDDYVAILKALDVNQ